MRQRNLIRTTAACSVLFAVALVLSACSSDSSSSSAGEAGTITLDGRTANDHGTQAVSGAEADVEVEVDSFYFQPTVLTGAAGGKVTLKITNDSSTVHNFSLTDQNIDTDIPAEGNVSVTVSFPASGTAVFFCKFHQSNGMVGALQVG